MLAEIDDFFYWQFSEPDNETDDGEYAEEDEPEEIDLPCSLDLAIDLYNAWDKHGVTASQYLSQPLWWRSLIRYFGSRQIKAKDMAEADKKERNELRGMMGG